MKKLISKALCVMLIMAAIPLNTLAESLVDTVDVYSPAMKRSIRVTVTLPSDYKTTKDSLATLYLLHGYGGDYANYVKRVPRLGEIATERRFAIVTPDGQDSWYFDSPIDSTMQFETFLTKELIPYIDKNYRTAAKREKRAITGLSMGGHGALRTALLHPDLYCAAGSMSGGVDFRPFSTKWSVAKRLGAYDKYPENWNRSTVQSIAENLTETPLALIFDVGVDDFFYNVNLQLHNTLLEKKIDHDFILRPGKHNWPYWRNSIEYQALFFDRVFRNAMD